MSDPPVSRSEPPTTKPEYRLRKTDALHWSYDFPYLSSRSTSKSDGRSNKTINLVHDTSMKMGTKGPGIFCDQARFAARVNRLESSSQIRPDLEGAGQFVRQKDWSVRIREDLLDGVVDQ